LKIRVYSVDFHKHTGETNDRIILYVYILENMDPNKLSEALEKTEGVVGFTVEMVS